MTSKSLTPAVSKPMVPARPTKKLVENNALVIEEKWEQICCNLTERLTSANKDLIGIYYDVGIQVLAMTAQPGSWGTHTAEEFAKRLDLSKHTIAASSRFAQMVAPYEVGLMVKANIKWSAAIAMVVVKEASVRHKLCEMYRVNKWTTEELKAEIRRILPAHMLDSPEKHGGLNHTICFKKVATQAHHVAQSVNQYVEFLDAFEKIPEKDRSPKAIEAHFSCINNLRELHRSLGEVLEDLD